MRSLTASEQAFTSCYTRKFALANIAAGKRALQMLNDGERSIDAWRVVQGPMSEVMKDLSIAHMLRGGDDVR